MYYYIYPKEKDCEKDSACFDVFDFDDQPFDDSCYSQRIQLIQRIRFGCDCGRYF